MRLGTNVAAIANAISWANDSDRPLFLVVLGTRPCYVKFAPLIAALAENDVPFLIIESGQHYDEALTNAKREFGYDRIIGATLNIRGSLAELASQIFDGVTELAELLGRFSPKYPVIPIVSGDTATASFFPQAWYLRMGIRSIHVEAGLRSYGPGNWDM